MSDNRALGTADYGVLGGMLGVSLAIGIYFAVRSKDSKDVYLLGDRKMGTVSVAVSMFVTLQSAISLLGVPADVYSFGTMYLYLYIGASATYVTGLFTCLPLIYPLRVTSVYEYFDLRFNSRAVRLLGTLTGMLQTIAYMAIALLSPGLALQAVAGLPLWWSIVIVGIVGTIYTAIGGIKSVVWTDVFQSTVILGGIIAVIVLGTLRVGGPQEVVRIALEGQRLQYQEISPDPRVRHTVWGLIFGIYFTWYTNLINQSMVQRICSVKTIKAAKLTYLINAPLVFIYGVMLTITGLVLYAYVFVIGCDPIESGRLDNRNQLMPFFVMHVLSSMPGVTGLYMSMLFSGALSTFSSGINALSANTVDDLLGPTLRRVRASERLTTFVAKVSVCIYGMLAIGLAYGARALSGPVTQIAMAVFGACGGPGLGIFLLGTLFTFTNKYGALVGGVTSLGITIWISVSNVISGRRPPTLPAAPTYACADGNASAFTTPYTSTSPYSVTTVPGSPLDGRFNVADISYVWYGLIGASVVLIVGVIVSLLTGRHKKEQIDPQLVFPFIRHLCKLEYKSQGQTKAQDRAMTNNRLSWDMYKDNTPGPGNAQERETFT